MKNKITDNQIAAKAKRKYGNDHFKFAQQRDDANVKCSSCGWIGREEDVIIRSTPSTERMFGLIHCGYQEEEVCPKCSSPMLEDYNSLEFTKDDEAELYKLETFNSIDGLSEKGIVNLNKLRSKKALAKKK